MTGWLIDWLRDISFFCQKTGRKVSVVLTLHVLLAMLWTINILWTQILLVKRNKHIKFSHTDRQTDIQTDNSCIVTTLYALYYEPKCSLSVGRRTEKIRFNVFFWNQIPIFFLLVIFEIFILKFVVLQKNVWSIEYNVEKAYFYSAKMYYAFLFPSRLNMGSDIPF